MNKPVTGILSGEIPGTPGFTEPVHIVIPARDDP